MATPQLRFKEFDGDWKLDSIGAVISNKSKKYDPEKSEKDLPCIELEHLSQQTGEILGTVSAKDQKSIKNVFDENSVLFGKLRPYLRKFAKPNFKGVCSSEIWVLTSKKIQPNFLFQYVQTDGFSELTEIQAGSKMPRADWQSISNGEILFPLSDEQTKIAAFLSAVDEKISQLTQKHQLLSQYKQGMMQKLFSQQIRFKADDGSEFGEWEEKLLSEIGSFKNGLNKDKDSFGFGFPFINLMDVFGKKVVQTDSLGLVDANQKDLENYDLKKGDVLFIRSSVKAEGVGQTALVTENLHNTVYSGFLIRFRDSYGLDLGFKKYCFMNNEFRLRLLAKSTTSANTNINQESLSALSIWIPCLEEQTKIANFLSSIDQKIEVVAQQIEQAKQWKKGLLQQMFV